MVAPALMTAEQVAAEATVSLSLIYAHLNDGRLPGYRFGSRGRGTWRVSRSDFELWLQSLRVSDRPSDDRPFKYL